MATLALPDQRRGGRDDSAPAITLIDRYLDEQRELTAVERFAQRHASVEAPLLARHYTALLPASPPGPDEQYAFEVDLDACSGCKACVAACNSLNGLDQAETWREVGLLYGGTDEQPFMQHVTTACHHCLDPACLNVCPVKAYEKDECTGIVRHLDDQCIGCQYCILACPYDVPKYSRARGIVRKCDMCSGRLAVGEAPACVQSCPNEAIRITIVSRQAAAENCELGSFLPGAPDPQHTQPTTNFKTRRAFPRNTLPADYYSVHPEHAHWPLVFMLVLTQLSVGAFLVEMLFEQFLGTAPLQGVRWLHALSALLFGLVALGASTLHLGRPHLAYRAIVGLGSSWLSREIVAFGAFALLAALYAVAVWLADRGSAAALSLQAALGWSVISTGLVGVLCSIMIYHCTGRRLWSASGTAARFLLTTIVLGLSTSLVTGLAEVATAAAPQHLVDARSLIAALIVASSVKLLFEASLFAHLGSRQQTPLKRSARLMTGELARITKWRFALGIGGGIVLPLLCLETNRGAAFAGLLIAGQFVMLLVGEVLERCLFFKAVAASRMPGGLRT